MDKEETVRLTKSQHLKLMQEKKELQEALDKANAKLKNIAEAVEEELTCSVCLCVLVEACKLECGHMFCKVCIMQCKLRNPYCPVCRQFIMDCDENPNVTHSFLEKLLPLLPGNTDQQWLESVKEYEESEQTLRQMKRQFQQEIKNHAKRNPELGLLARQEVAEELAHIKRQMEAIKEQSKHGLVSFLEEEILENPEKREELGRLIEEMSGNQLRQSNSREVRDNYRDLITSAAARMRMPSVATQSSLYALPGTSLSAQITESAPGASVVSKDPVLGFMQEQELEPWSTPELPTNKEEYRNYIRSAPINVLRALTLRRLQVSLERPQSAQSTSLGTSQVSQKDIQGSLQKRSHHKKHHSQHRKQKIEGKSIESIPGTSEEPKEKKH